eukprot:2623515-Rhodomonas_salina.3
MGPVGTLSCSLRRGRKRPATAPGPQARPPAHTQGDDVVVPATLTRGMDSASSSLPLERHCGAL